jgi:hypothetical protein
MDMNHRIKEMAETWGADFCGVADLSLAHDAILAQGGPVIAAYPRAIEEKKTLSWQFVACACTSAPMGNRGILSRRVCK